MTSIEQPLRLGMIGGASGALIGPVHRRAAAYDGRFVLAAGVLSSDPVRARAEGPKVGIAADRAYGTVEEMLAAEARRPDGIEAVAIVTPNDSHYRFASAALAAGLDVICDKPLTNRLAEALDLADIVARTGLVFCLTHNYSGYPMIRQARAMVAAGTLGTIRCVQVEYLGSGLAGRVEGSPDAHRRWRLDPARSGASLVLGDIGTHAHHLASFVLGEAPARLSAEVGTVVPGRRVSDYASVRLAFPSGARGTLLACQAATGQENHMLVRVIGEKATLEWRHREHNYLMVSPLEGPTYILSRGQPQLAPAAKRAARIPRTGHPEGFHEAFANLYFDAAEAISARLRGRAADPAALDFPNVRDGVRGVRFIEAAVESSARDGAWVECAI